MPIIPGVASTLGSESRDATAVSEAAASKTPSKRAYKSTNKIVETMRSDLNDALAEHRASAAQQNEVFASLLDFLKADKKKKKKTQEDSESDSDSDSSEEESVVVKPVKKKRKRLGGKPTKMKTRRS